MSRRPSVQTLADLDGQCVRRHGVVLAELKSRDSRFAQERAEILSDLRLLAERLVKVEKAVEHAELSEVEPRLRARQTTLHNQMMALSDRVDGKASIMAIGQICERLEQLQRTVHRAVEAMAGLFPDQPLLPFAALGDKTGRGVPADGPEGTNKPLDTPNKR